jgi:hypothetical protein
VLCCAVLCCAVLCCAVLCCAVLCAAACVWLTSIMPSNQRALSLTPVRPPVQLAAVALDFQRLDSSGSGYVSRADVQRCRLWCEYDPAAADAMLAKGGDAPPGDSNRDLARCVCVCMAYGARAALVLCGVSTMDTALARCRVLPPSHTPNHHEHRALLC